MKGIVLILLIAGLLSSVIAAVLLISGSDPSPSNIDGKTQYRKVTRASFDFLQYKSVIGWVDVPRAYISDWGNKNGSMFQHVVSSSAFSYGYSLSSFPRKWPNIERYLIEYRKDQERLNSRHQKKLDALYANDGKVEYFND